MKLTTIILLPAFCLFLAFSCSGNGPDLTNKSMEQIAKMIADEVGPAEAEAADRCDMTPIGIKPAGGPWGYLVFSTQISDRAKLERLIERYNQLDADRNEAEDRISSADFAIEPDLILIDGICHGDGNYAWNPGDILTFSRTD